ncbi:MAG: hypothetical protein FJ117_07365 [Deltaproteobacteria bacterium]|nr:hypothetical protein [Deltaproteobacteria bacterium]
MGRWGYFDFFAPSIPRKTKGGIKAQSQRGTFGESWWAKRWIAVLESFNIGARLGRGRSYARSGQVLSVEIEKGQVKAKVQGSRPKPYEVSIHIKAITPSDWQKLARALSRQAIFTAKLLGGEMPQDIERVFKDEGLSVFPEKLKDLQTNCSCPDWSNPCKHIAAVYYLLGEEFDRDPFLIFKLRGMARDELLKILSLPAQKNIKEKVRPKPSPSREQGEMGLPSEPLTSEAADFWNGGSLPEDFWGEVQIPPVSAALVRRLGKFPFWRGEEFLLEAIEPIYSSAATQGMGVFLGEKNSPGHPQK